MRSFKLGSCYAFVAVVAGLLPAACISQAREANRPNIILIVADDLGYGELGCYGQKWIKTPRIDRLAQEGMKFTQFYCGSPVCAPSRCVLLTGKHPGHAYVRDNGKDTDYQKLKEQHGWEYPGQRPIPDSEITLAEMLKQQGYATGAMGKWGLGHFGTSGDPNKQGFDLFFGYNSQWHAHNHYPWFLWRNRQKVQYPGNDGKSLNGETFSQDEFTREALEFVRTHQSEPFFLYLPFAVPHLSIQVPASSLAEYQGEIPEQDYKHRGYLPHPSPRAGYAAMISHMDRDIGKVVDLVEELGLSENTLILFTSDNGPTFNRLGGSDSNFFNSADGLRGRKGSVYEGGIRVPLVVRWKGHIAPAATSNLVSAFWDFMPTFGAISGATVPDAADGVSLVPTLTGTGEQATHEHLLWEFAGYGGQQAVRLGDWKGVRRNTKRGNRQIELYNLKDDRAESRDVAKSHPEIVEQIEHILQTDRTESEIDDLFGRAG